MSQSYESYHLPIPKKKIGLKTKIYYNLEGEKKFLAVRKYDDTCRDYDY